MTKQEIDNMPNHAGVYLIRNKVNGKCYIGQAVKLRTRLRAHWSNYIGKRYPNIVLYRAFEKYGVENFELKILKEFYDSLGWRTKQNLDIFEKKYIQEYNSYTNGYNSTLGGDAGVLGYRHSEETLEVLRKSGRAISEKKEQELCQDPSNWIKVRNIETGEVFVFKTRRELEIELDINRCVIRNCLLGRQKIAYKKWQIIYYNEKFEELPELGSEEFKEMMGLQFRVLSSKDEIKKYIEANPKCTYGEVSQNFSLSKKTFWNYKQELGIKLEQRVDTKVRKEEFVEFIKDHSKSECMAHFNIPERLFYKYKNKYLDEKIIK